MAADGKIYLANEDGEVIVVAAGREFKHVVTNSTGELLMATPALSHGVMYIRGMNHLFAIGRPATDTRRPNCPRGDSLSELFLYPGCRPPRSVGPASGGSRDRRWRNHDSIGTMPALVGSVTRCCYESVEA